MLHGRHSRKLPMPAGSHVRLHQTTCHCGTRCAMSCAAGSIKPWCPCLGVLVGVVCPWLVSQTKSLTSLQQDMLQSSSLLGRVTQLQCCLHLCHPLWCSQVRLPLHLHASLPADQQANCHLWSNGTHGAKQWRQLHIEDPMVQKVQEGVLTYAGKCPGHAQ